jgi:hypothetical protein
MYREPFLSCLTDLVRALYCIELSYHNQMVETSSYITRKLVSNLYPPSGSPPPGGRWGSAHTWYTLRQEEEMKFSHPSSFSVSFYFTSVLKVVKLCLWL